MAIKAAIITVQQKVLFMFSLMSTLLRKKNEDKVVKN